MYKFDGKSWAWKQKTLTYEDFARWFNTTQNGPGGKHLEKKEIAAQVADIHNHLLAADIDDDEGLDLITRVLDDYGANTSGFDLDLFETNTRAIFEFLKVDLKQKYVNVRTSHPMIKSSLKACGR